MMSNYICDCVCTGSVRLHVRTYRCICTCLPRDTVRSFFIPHWEHFQASPIISFIKDLKLDMFVLWRANFGVPVKMLEMKQTWHGIEIGWKPCSESKDIGWDWLQPVARSPGGNFVAESFANLRDAKGDLLPHHICHLSVWPVTSTV